MELDISGRIVAVKPIVIIQGRHDRVTPVRVRPVRLHFNHQSNKYLQKGHYT